MIIKKVSSHEMTLDIDGEMTVVGHLAINYVTSIDTETTDQEQLVHYCTSDGLKFETVNKILLYFYVSSINLNVI